MRTFGHGVQFFKMIMEFFWFFFTCQSFFVFFCRIQSFFFFSKKTRTPPRNQMGRPLVAIIYSFLHNFDIYKDSMLWVKFSMFCQTTTSKNFDNKYPCRPLGASHLFYGGGGVRDLVWTLPRAVATFPLSKNLYFRKIAYKYLKPSHTICENFLLANQSWGTFD